MIYDFYEFLGRGIIAARTRRYKEAVKFLNLAAKIEPSNPRVWLWLATASDTAAGKQNYLREALNVDPNNLAARVLLERFNQTETVSSAQTSKAAIFTCPHCGGKQRFDPDILGLQCEYCGNVEILGLESGSVTESSLSDVLQKGSGNWAFIESQSTCSACGAKTSHPPSQTTIRCPFCNSDMVTTQSATPNLVSPAGIAPFQYHGNDVLKMIGKHWKIPARKLSQLINSLEITISSVYLPFWTFDGTVQILCALEYRVPPVTYSLEERVFLKGEWPTEKSWFECNIDDLLVYVGRSVSNESIGSIFPFDLKSMLEYRPEILAGWQAENYQIALEDAAIESHKLMRDLAFKRATHRKLFMQPSQMLQNDVLVIDKTYKLILLPVWVINRTSPDNVSQALINGQSGKLSERKSGWLDFLKR
jgi:DNA-directed RNA polymerase subunit RPC12/RpoP